MSFLLKFCLYRLVIAHLVLKPFGPNFIWWLWWVSFKNIHRIWWVWFSDHVCVRACVRACVCAFCCGFFCVKWWHSKQEHSESADLLGRGIPLLPYCPPPRFPIWRVSKIQFGNLTRRCALKLIWGVECYSWITTTSPCRMAFFLSFFFLEQSSLCRVRFHFQERASLYHRQRKYLWFVSCKTCMKCKCQK